MNNKSILIINDVTGYGRVSSFAILPVMAQYGLHPYVLPTALVSNTMDYGSSEILDTTGFMRSTIRKWNEFGFRFNNICTGLINSSEQVDIIAGLIADQESPFVMVDPIMADGGELYDNMYEGAVECNRRLAAMSDLLVPNLTEAEMLADMYIGNDTLTDEEYSVLIRKLSELGAHDIVITGCCSPDGTGFNLIYDSAADKVIKQEFQRIPTQFIGTGDLFSACLISEKLTGRSLYDSVKTASEFVRSVILANLDNEDHFDLYIEGSLQQLNAH